MQKIILDLISSLQDSDDRETCQSAIRNVALTLKQNGFSKEAETLQKTFKYQENILSQRNTWSNFFEAKERTVQYLEELCLEFKPNSEMNSIKIVESILRNFHLYCKYLYKSRIHGKCSQELKQHLIGFSIQNEYDLQKLLFPAIALMFPDARQEETDDTGHHTIRKDIVLDADGIVIELKCTRASMTEREISEEIGSDMIHYKEQQIFFYIYDKDNVIQSPSNFKKTYEDTSVDGKQIHVIILQENTI